LCKGAAGAFFDVKIFVKMLNTILGKKMNMSQVFIGETRVPVTKVVAGPCVVTHVKNQDRDGYWAVQIGYGERKLKNTSKALQGHLKGVTKEKVTPRFLREVRVNETPKEKVGDELNVSDVFKKGDIVSVTAKSKGKGFAGVVKRWGFAGGPKTHGQSDRWRAPGSIGQGTTPGRVWKGKKMAGRMGYDTITINGLTVVDLDPKNNELVLSGSIPGPTGGLLSIRRVAHGDISELEESAPEVEKQVEEPKEGQEEKETQSSEGEK